MRRITVDKSVLVRRFSRSMATYECAAVVQRDMAEQLVADVRRIAGADRFDRVVELGCGTGLLTRRLLENCRVSDLVLNDLVPECERTAGWVREHEPHVTVQFLRGDMEDVEFPDEQDLIVSSAVLQWAADLPSLLKRLVGCLRPDGILAMASFGPSNLCEVSQLTGSSLRYWSAAEWRTALAADCRVLNGSDDTRTLWFSSAREVVQHLKQTGVNALDSRPWSSSKILEFCRTYESTFGEEGKVPLTYHPVFLVARRAGSRGSGT